MYYYFGLLCIAVIERNIYILVFARRNYLVIRIFYYFILRVVCGSMRIIVMLLYRDHWGKIWRVIFFISLIIVNNFEIQYFFFFLRNFILWNVSFYYFKYILLNTFVVVKIFFTKFYICRLLLTKKFIFLMLLITK